MPIRYSGDVEVRIRRDGDRYVARVRMPGERGRVVVSAWEVGRGPESVVGSRDLDSSETYDEVAFASLRAAEAKLGSDLPVEWEPGSKGKIVIRRRFQAPCPILRQKRVR